MKNDMKTAAMLAVVSISLMILFAVSGSLTVLLFSYLFLVGSTVMEYQCSVEKESQIKLVRTRKEYQVQREREYWQYREKLIAQKCADIRNNEEAS